MNCARSFTPKLFLAVVLFFPATTLLGLTGTYGDLGLTGTYGDFEYTVSGFFKPESFYGKNISLLNNSNCDVDKVWYSRHTFDFNFGVLYGKEKCGHSVVECFTTIRNRSIWGDVSSIAATSDATFKLVEAVIGAHRHTFPRHIFWLREVWLKFDLGDVTGLGCFGGHTFTLGAFPFELGLGIALGSAFAVGPEPLGFYVESSVDQYAFGAKFSGDVIENVLFYDLYASILDSKMGTSAQVAAKIRGQEFGRLETPARGFGKANFLVAGRLDWHLFEDVTIGSFHFEPYVFFNHEAEQKIEFRGDASSRLGTFGFFGEYEHECGGFVFDCALNRGRQRVKGWDRNQIEVQGDGEGKLCLVNSHVRDTVPTFKDNILTDVGKKVPFRTDETCTLGGATVSDDAQNLINMAYQDESQNGKRIGVSRCGHALFNAVDRYRNSYSNRYRGWMAVFDGYFKPFPCADVKVCAAIGIASGDDNPNEDTRDGEFAGFIGLQELYAGRRVKSAFLLGGAGRIKRPLSQRDPDRNRNRFLLNISGFTNLAFVGSAVQWRTQFCSREFFFHPNVIVYWNDRTTRKFDIKTGQDLKEKASHRLGFEANLFSYYYLLDSMKLFWVGSLFVPGQFYTDIKGKPLSKDDQTFLDRFDRTGFTEDRIPNIGDDLAYTFNIGVDFNF